MKPEYLFGFKKEPQDYTVVIIVPKEYWEKNQTTYPGYIPDDDLVNTLESMELYECMENTFEISSYSSIEEVKRILGRVEDLEYSKEFEEFINMQEVK